MKDRMSLAARKKQIEAVRASNQRRRGETRSSRQDVPTYRAMHNRLRREHGTPLGCSNDPFHSGPFEWGLCGWGTNDGPRGSRYSVFFTDYKPLCRACNRRETRRWPLKLKTPANEKCSLVV